MSGPHVRKQSSMVNKWGSCRSQNDVIIMDAVVESSGSFYHLELFNAPLNLSTLASSITPTWKFWRRHYGSTPRLSGQQSSTVIIRIQRWVRVQWTGSRKCADSKIPKLASTFLTMVDVFDLIFIVA
uniref:Uncharacterized protein n=1 Tax=Rhipicephalus appendiculatus TaxID=34631 RepID=A0A131Z598_RHIAP